MVRRITSEKRTPTVPSAIAAVAGAADFSRHNFHLGIVMLPVQHMFASQYEAFLPWRAELMNIVSLRLGPFFILKCAFVALGVQDWSLLRSGQHLVIVSRIRVRAVICIVWHSTLPTLVPILHLVTEHLLPRDVWLALEPHIRNPAFHVPFTDPLWFSPSMWFVVCYILYAAAMLLCRAAVSVLLRTCALVVGRRRNERLEVRTTTTVLVVFALL